MDKTEMVNGVETRRVFLGSEKRKRGRGKANKKTSYDKVMPAVQEGELWLSARLTTRFIKEFVPDSRCGWVLYILYGLSNMRGTKTFTVSRGYLVRHKCGSKSSIRTILDRCQKAGLLSLTAMGKGASYQITLIDPDDGINPKEKQKAETWIKKAPVKDLRAAISGTTIQPDGQILVSYDPKRLEKGRLK